MVTLCTNAGLPFERCATITADATLRSELMPSGPEEELSAQPWQGPLNSSKPCSDLPQQSSFNPSQQQHPSAFDQQACRPSSYRRPSAGRRPSADKPERRPSASKSDSKSVRQFDQLYNTLAGDVQLPQIDPSPSPSGRSESPSRVAGRSDSKTPSPERRPPGDD